jgi:ribonuclease HI
MTERMDRGDGGYDEVRIYTDGGARGNPGPAALGVVIQDSQGNIIARIREYLGVTTNNQAEYQALIVGLEHAAKLHAKQVSCFMDSELVVRQLTGKYRIRDKKLQVRAKRVLELALKFRKVDFHHVPRTKNKLADRLVNQAIDEFLSKQQ